MVLSKKAVANANLEFDNLVKDSYAVYEQKMNTRLSKNDWNMTYQLDNRWSLAAMKKLISSYRKAGWHVEIELKNAAKCEELSKTGLWQFKFD
jgi:hypothetical protein